MPAGNTVRQLNFLVDVDDRATRKLMQIDAVADEMGEDLEATAAQLDLLGGALKTVGTVAVGAAAGVGLLAWQGAKLSRPMSIIQSTTNATTQTMSGLRDEIQRIGAETPVTVKDAATAFKELSYAGLETQEIFAAGQDVVELAIAGNLQMGESAKIAAQNMRAFNLEASQVGAVADTLAAVFADSATEIQGLANGLSYVNATASQLGFSMTETTAALGALADRAIEGTRAGTSLNQAFAKLFAQTGKVKESLSAVNLSIQDFTDEKGETKDMLEIFEIIATRMEELNMSDAGIAAWATDVFGRRGARAIQPLIQDLDNLEQKQQQASFAQFKSQLKELRDATSEEVVDIEAALFGDQDQEVDILGMAPTNNEVFKALRERYGQGSGAAAQIEAALQNAFPEMEDFASEQIAETLAAGADEISDAELESAFEESEKSAAQLRSELTETEMALAVANSTVEEATTDAEIYAEYVDSVGGALKYLKGSISAVADEMFLGLRPALMAVLKTGMSFFDWLRDQPKLLNAMGKALGGVAVAATAATVALGGLYAVVSLKMLAKLHGHMWQVATSGGKLAGVFTKAGNAAKWFVGALKGGPAALAKFVSSGSMLSKTFGGLVQAGGKFVGLLKWVVSLLNPVTLAIGTAIAFMALWASDFKGFREKVKPFTDALGGAAEGIMNFATAVTDWAMWALGGLYDTMDDTGAIEFAVGVFAEMFNIFGTGIMIVTRFLHYMGRLADVFGEGIWSAFVKRDLSGIIDAAWELYNVIHNVIEEVSGKELDLSMAFPDPPAWLDWLFPGSDKTPEGDATGGDTSKKGGGRKSAGDKFIDTVLGFGPRKAREAGEAEQKAYAKGRDEGRKHVTEAQRKTAKESAKYMGSSDAKKGPLSNVTQRGAGILKAYSKGMRRARGTATTAAKGSMGAIARQLGPDGLREKGDSTFGKLATQVERIHDPLETARDLLEATHDIVKSLLGRLRQFRNFRLTLGNVTGPLSNLYDWVDENIGGVDTLTDWISGLEVMEPSLSGLETALDNLQGWIEDAANDFEDLADDISSAGPRRERDDSGGDGGDGDGGGSTGPNLPGRGAPSYRNLPSGEGGGTYGGGDINPNIPNVGMYTSDDSDDEDDEDDESERRSAGALAPGMNAPAKLDVASGLVPDHMQSGDGGGQATRKAQSRQQAAQRAQQAGEPFMPRAYNAFRSGIIPSFVPTLGDSSTQQTDQQSDSDDTSDESSDDESGGEESGGEESGGDTTGPDSGDTTDSGETISAMGTTQPAASSPDVTVEDNRTVSVDNSGGDTDQLREELLRELNASNERLVDDLIRSLYADADGGGGAGSLN